MSYSSVFLSLTLCFQTLGDSTGKSATNPATRKAAKRLQKHNEYLDALSVIGILPTTIDTPANRVAMPDSDFDTWTKPNDIAKEIGVRSAVAAV